MVRRLIIILLTTLVLKLNIHTLWMTLISVQDYMDKAFVVANEYRSKFEPYRTFYSENENLDVQELEQSDHGKHTSHIVHCVLICGYILCVQCIHISWC